MSFRKRFGIEWAGKANGGSISRDAEQIRDLLAIHGVLVVRNQLLSTSDFLELARLFGPPIRPVQLPTVPDWVIAAFSDERRGFEPQIGSASLVKGVNEWCVLLKDVRVAGAETPSIEMLCIGTKNGISTEFNLVNQIDIFESVGDGKVDRTDVWHSDMSYLERPPSIGLFYAPVAPEDGSGPTAFCDMASPVDVMSTKLRDLLAQCSASHSADAHVRRLGAHRGRHLMLPGLPEPVEHPIIRSVDGKNCLYVNPFYTDFVAGLSVEESDPLLNMLFCKCAIPEFSFVHHWEAGDLVLWDNRSTMHYGVRNVSDGLPRKLMRILVEGERPIPGS